jgi:hypothetical protein
VIRSNNEPLEAGPGPWPRRPAEGPEGIDTKRIGCPVYVSQNPACIKNCHTLCICSVELADSLRCIFGVFVSNVGYALGAAGAIVCECEFSHRADSIKEILCCALALSFLRIYEVISYIQVILRQVVMQILDTKFRTGRFARMGQRCPREYIMGRRTRRARGTSVCHFEEVFGQLGMREPESKEGRDTFRTVIVKLIVNPFSAYWLAEWQLTMTGGHTSQCFYCLLESTVRKRGKAWVS